MVISDEPQRAWARSVHLQGCSQRIRVKEDPATAFHIMRLAPVSVIADSTFSYWASLMSSTKELVISPALNSSSDQCWSYLQGSQDQLLESGDWVSVPARTLSAEELLTQE